jgi:hypothetical protein
MRQTNPISRRGRVGRGMRDGGRGDEMRQTKPTPGRAGWDEGHGEKQAKRTQFRPAWAGPGPRWAKSATSPRCPASGNEPNSGRSPVGQGHRDGGCGGNRAKQTQFAPERCEGQVPYAQRVMVNWRCKGPWQNKAKLGQDERSGRWRIRGGQLCKTKPIPGKARWDEATGTGDAGSKRATSPRCPASGNEPNSRRGRAVLSRPSTLRPRPPAGGGCGQ